MTSLTDWSYSSFWDYGNVQWAVVESNGMLFDVSFFLIVCAANSKRKYNSFIYSFFSCMFFCFGGGCLIGLMIGEPFSIFRSDDYIVVYAVTWFTLFFTPLRKLIHTPVVECVVHAASCVSWMRAIIAAFHLSRRVYPDSIFACLFFSTLAGSSADIINSIERRWWGEKVDVNLTGARVTLTTTVFYLIVWQHCGAVEWSPQCVIEEKSAQLIIVAYLMVWGWILILTGRDLDIFRPAEVIFNAFAKRTWWNTRHDDAVLQFDTEFPPTKRTKME